MEDISRKKGTMTKVKQHPIEFLNNKFPNFKGSGYEHAEVLAKKLKELGVDSRLATEENAVEMLRDLHELVQGIRSFLGVPETDAKMLEAVRKELLAACDSTLAEQEVMKVELAKARDAGTVYTEEELRGQNEAMH